MPAYEFVTVDVFTDQRFGGNPLAVFPAAQGLTDTEMRDIAREFNLSETVFVLPASHPAHTARIRIFTPAGEIPFAGHPNVGTGFVLAGRRIGAKRRGPGLRGVGRSGRGSVERDAESAPIGAMIAAPHRSRSAKRFGRNSSPPAPGSTLAMFVTTLTRLWSQASASVSRSWSSRVRHACPRRSGHRRVPRAGRGDPSLAGHASLHLYFATRTIRPGSVRGCSRR